MALMRLLCSKMMNRINVNKGWWWGPQGREVDIYIGGCSLEEACGSVGVNMQYSAVSCPPAVRAVAATALLGGLGHRLPSAPLSVVRLNRSRGERVVQPLLWHHCTTAEEMKKKTSDCIITQWIQSLPHQHFSFSPIHSFSSPHLFLFFR